MRQVLRKLLLGALVVLLVFMIIFWSDTQRWFYLYTGANNPTGSWYGFWSGFGGAIPDFLLIGSLITLYRHHNCHVKGCPRIGKPVDGTPYLACPTHHPAHHGDHRSVSQDVISLAHHAHLDHDKTPKNEGRDNTR